MFRWWYERPWQVVMGCGASAGTKKPPDPPADDSAAKKVDRSEDKKAAQLENKDTVATVFLFFPLLSL